jgi:acetylornithine/succinyldiaminopimelate/putrescine aminotransferase
MERLKSSWENVAPDRFKFEKSLGGGARGSAWLYQEIRDGKIVRRFVIKYADNDVGVQTVEKEIQVLRVS